MAPGSALTITKLSVLADRVRAELVCAQAWQYTTPQLAQQIAAMRPHIAHHTCINGKGDTFSAVMDHTPLPHLLEHLVVDLLVEGSDKDETVYVGTSEWVAREEGRARVEVSFTDDLKVLAAFKQASELINNLVSNMTSS